MALSRVLAFAALCVAWTMHGVGARRRGPILRLVQPAETGRPQATGSGPKPPGDDLPPIVPRESSAPPPPDDRPYDNKLMRLAEILGAVHYLRELCGAEEGQIWRDQMKDILRNEGTTAVRRAKLVNSFNDGYRGYRRTYRTCTQSATVATMRFSSEGAPNRRLAGPGLRPSPARRRPMRSPRPRPMPMAMPRLPAAIRPGPRPKTAGAVAEPNQAQDSPPRPLSKRPADAGAPEPRPRD